MKRLSEEQLKMIGGEVFNELLPDYSEENENEYGDAALFVDAMITVVIRYMNKYQEKICDGV